MTESTFNKAKALQERIEYLKCLIDLFASFVGPDVMGRSKAIASVALEAMNSSEFNTSLIHWEPLEEDIAAKFVGILKEQLHKAEEEFAAL